MIVKFTFDFVHQKQRERPQPKSASGWWQSEDATTGAPRGDHFLAGTIAQAAPTNSFMEVEETEQSESSEPSESPEPEDAHETPHPNAGVRLLSDDSDEEEFWRAPDANTGKDRGNHFL